MPWLLCNSFVFNTDIYSSPQKNDRDRNYLVVHRKVLESRQFRTQCLQTGSVTRRNSPSNLSARHTVPLLQRLPSKKSLVMPFYLRKREISLGGCVIFTNPMLSFMILTEDTFAGGLLAREYNDI